MPLTNLSGRWLSVVAVLAIWFATLGIGQFGFFSTQKLIESSRLSSLLGLKILVLVTIDILINRHLPGGLQFCGALLCVGSAFVMNWSGSSGKSKSSGMSFLLLAVTLLFYSLTDIVETRIVNMQQSGNVVQDGIISCLLCYAFMGVFTLPFLFKVKWNWSEQFHSVPFGVLWLISQITLMICFGVLGTVFGNVLQACRGLISVLLGAAVCAIGWGKLDAPATGKIWLRRACGALLMSAGIVCYTLGTLK